MVVVGVLIVTCIGRGVLETVYRGLPRLPLAIAYMTARLELSLLLVRCVNSFVILVVEVGLMNIFLLVVSNPHVSRTRWLAITLTRLLELLWVVLVRRYEVGPLTWTVAVTARGPCMGVLCMTGVVLVVRNFYTWGPIEHLRHFT